MKHILSILMAALLLASCGSDNKKSIEDIIADGDLTTIREKRSEIVAQQQLIADQIKQLDDKIAILDTTKRIPLITTFTAKEIVFNHFLELQGNVQTKQNLVIYPEMAGVLRHVYVK